MKWARIWAMILRHAFLLKTPIASFGFCIGLLVDIALWDLRQNWVNINQTTASTAGLALITTAAVFWQLVNRAGFEVSSSLL